MEVKYRKNPEEVQKIEEKQQYKRK